MVLLCTVTVSQTSLTSKEGCGEPCRAAPSFVIETVLCLLVSLGGLWTGAMAPHALSKSAPVKNWVEGAQSHTAGRQLQWERKLRPPNYVNYLKVLNTKADA